MEIETEIRATRRGDWLTNHPKPAMSWAPRRKAKMKVGPPKATNTYSVEQLEEKNYIGIYLDEDIPEGIKSREIVRDQKKLIPICE